MADQMPLPLRRTTVDFTEVVSDALILALPQGVVELLKRPEVLEALCTAVEWIQHRLAEKKQAQEGRLLTEQEACKKLRISARTLHRRVKDNPELAKAQRKVGSRVLYSEAALNAWQRGC